MIRIEPYTTSMLAEWDRFVSGARNGHFMFSRGYVEYHGDRFRDSSLLFWQDDELCGVLPANLADDTLWTHQGLSFGGLVVSPRQRTADVLAMFLALRGWLQEQGIRRLVYKPLPHIYQMQPSEDDIYALFRLGAAMYRVDASTTIDMRNPGRVSSGKKSGYNKAIKAGATIVEDDDFDSFFRMVETRLQEKYQAEPVHDAAEMAMLKARFPRNIRMFSAIREGRRIAGCILYVTDRVVHAQYISSTDEGRELRAVDAIILHLLRDEFAGVAFFDFGNSNEDQGRILNASLCSQKEEFGGRATVQMFYQLQV